MQLEYKKDEALKNTNKVFANGKPIGKIVKEKSGYWFHDARIFRAIGPFDSMKAAKASIK
jgi:hypothetical protein